uniref:Uncharacterized protein n=1 Tax=Siphoviridae sp. ctLgc23 TaxID=2825455 RepID=A0A8S5QHD1_9CAUD|nr:MAG TPA: hypothetical protein [Siphoviridae sp. ctLgc23]
MHSPHFRGLFLSIGKRSGCVLFYSFRTVHP